MKPYYELAYALASESLCLFVGTGFSKYLTNNTAPSWLELLKKCCQELDDSEQLIDELFPKNTPIMPLEECASVISLQMIKEGKSLNHVIAKEIKAIKADPGMALKIKEFVKKHPHLTFITTNYDLLIENDVIDGLFTGHCQGFPINRQRVGTDIYHIHGSVNLPDKMVVTADDYYRFVNFPNYFGKRLDTLIEENTTVIIGYSLGDFNFKTILNSHRYSGSNVINRQHLFFLSRKSVPQHVKDYYDATYGLRVIDGVEVDEFFSSVDAKYELIKKNVGKAKGQLRSVIEGKAKYKDSFLKEEESFARILATLSSTGFRIVHPKAILFLRETLEKKVEFARENGAWEQYRQLAIWLVQLGCVMDIDGTDLEDFYVSSVIFSFSSMSKKNVLGKSWDAYKVWLSGWGSITFKNRAMMRRYVHDNSLHGDFESFIHV